MWLYFAEAIYCYCDDQSGAPGARKWEVSSALFEPPVSFPLSLSIAVFVSAIMCVLARSERLTLSASANCHEHKLHELNEECATGHP